MSLPLSPPDPPNRFTQTKLPEASNFKMIGETAPSKHIFWNGKRYHPRSLSIDRDYSVKLNQAIRNGQATIEEGLPKLIYEYEIKRPNQS
jgi:macrodomain Ter protein organizer (MatP/YcbG family)